MEVVGDDDEADFSGYVFEASEHKLSESFILSHVPEYRFDLPSLPSFSPVLHRSLEVVLSFAGG